MNNLYDIARVRLLTAAINWPVEDLVLSVWDGPPDFVATDETLADILARGHVERGSSLPINGTGVKDDGTAQTDNVIVPDVAVGADITWMTMSRQDAVHANCELVQFIDQAYGLPYVPNGLDMFIQPDWVEGRGWFRP